jgi:hyperosmotically inducible protein
MKLAHKKWTVATWIFTFACLFNIGNLPAMESVNLSQQVRQNLITLPYYSIFDYLAFELDGSNVTITGQVYRDTLKSDAENALKRIPGIGSIKNDIEVLPLSTSDDRIRLDMYRAIYYHPEFQRYAIQAVPPIHILVENGNVTLYGSVSTELDRNLAGLRAKGVPGVFSVTNKLKVSP